MHHARVSSEEIRRARMGGRGKSMPTVVWRSSNVNSSLIFYASLDKGKGEIVKYFLGFFYAWIL